MNNSDLENTSIGNGKLFNRNFTMVIIGQIISILGNAILRFALPLYLLDKTNSSAVFGTVMAISVIPMIVLSPFAGVCADRINKRNIMAVLDFITSGLLVSFFFGLNENNAVSAITAVMLALSVIQTFYTPAVSSCIPLLLEKNKIVSGNAAVNQVNSFSMLVGPIIGAAIYSFFGIGPIIIISALSFLASAVLELFIVIPHKAEKLTQGIWATVVSDFKESFRFISREKPIILALVCITAGINFVFSGMQNVGIPYIMRLKLGISDNLYGLSQSISAVGALLGGVLVGIFAAKMHIKKSVIFLFMMSFFFVPIAVSLMVSAPVMTTYVVVVASRFLITIAATFFNVMTISFMQQETPVNMLGKTTSLVFGISLCALPIGQAMFGFLFDRFQSGTHWVIFGSLIAGMGIVAASWKIFKNV